MRNSVDAQSRTSVASEVGFHLGVHRGSGCGFDVVGASRSSEGRWGPLHKTWNGIAVSVWRRELSMCAADNFSQSIFHLIAREKKRVASHRHEPRPSPQQTQQAGSKPFASLFSVASVASRSCRHHECWWRQWHGVPHSGDVGDVPGSFFANA